MSDEMIDVIGTLRKIKGRAFYSGRADLLYTEEAREVERAMVEAITEIERLRAELAEHERRAALVATWADGLRAGKWYETAGGDGFKWEAWGIKMGPNTFRFRVLYGFIELTDFDPARAAAYMLSISETWKEVGA